MELIFYAAKLLSWLDGFDCTDKHEFTLRLRQQTTGEWLFKEQLYLDWRDGSIDFVWLHGKGWSLIIHGSKKLTRYLAGAGKSVLAYVILYIHSQTSGSLFVYPPLLMTFHTD